MNADFLIDNEGEASGAYPTLDSLEIIRAENDRTGLEFGVGYRINIQAPSGTGTLHGTVQPQGGRLRRLQNTTP